MNKVALFNSNVTKNYFFMGNPLDISLLKCIIVYNYIVYKGGSYEIAI